MTIEAVVFDWGGTLSIYADIDLADMWQLAAEHLARETGRSATELHAKLIAAEQRYWDNVNRRSVPARSARSSPRSHARSDSMSRRP